MAATVFSETQHPYAGVLALNYNVSIDEVIIAQNQNIQVGQVLGAIGVVANATVAYVAAAGNTGTSTIGSMTVSTTVQNGGYNVVLLATGATAAFEVQRPDGTVDGTGKVGTAYTGQVNFTMTAGGTPTIGDAYTINVVRPFDEGGEQYGAWSPGATDGSQIPRAIALYPALTGASQTAKIGALVRDGAYRLGDAVFGSSSFTAQQSTTTLTVTALAPGSGPIVLGATVASTGTTQTITAFGTGTGGVGTYTVSVSQTLASQSMTAAPTAAQVANAVEQLAAVHEVIFR